MQLISFTNKDTKYFIIFNGICIEASLTHANIL